MMAVRGATLEITVNVRCSLELGSNSHVLTLEFRDAHVIA